MAESSTSTRESDRTSPAFSYPGICSICGARGDFRRGPQPSVRESFPCDSCGYTLRWRDQASIIVNEFGQGREISLSRMVRSGLLDDVHIYEPALGGPFVSSFKSLSNFRTSYYWEGGSPGDVVDGVEFQDLGRLSLPDASLDLVITSDVFEHVIDPLQAFAEIARVLKPGGIHVFSIPTGWPLPERSVERSRLVNGEMQFLLPPRYHRAGDGSDSLVITDWGTDIIEVLRPLGLSTQIHRVSGAIDPAYQNATLVSRRVTWA